MTHHSFDALVVSARRGGRVVRVVVPSGYKWGHAIDVATTLGWYLR
jgi:hypothetical protein